MGLYKHITLDERVALGALLAEGYEHSEIAEALGKNITSISREVLRNSNLDGRYLPHRAHRRTQQRRKESKVSSRKIENDKGLRKDIESMLGPLCSPETICHESNLNTCASTIYVWIYRSRPDLMVRLPYHGKRRRKYGHKRGIKQGWTRHVRSIDERSEAANNRTELYHYEGDTVHGVNGKLLTYTERVSRFETALLIPDAKCDIVHEKTKEYFADYPARSITYDRGSEFALWKMIEKDLDIDVYFADPHSPWQRGTNENTNGRLRKIFPKKFNFGTVTQKSIDRVVWKMNHTKRKCLDWRTPCEVYKACCTST